MVHFLDDGFSAKLVSQFVFVRDLMFNFHNLLLEVLLEFGIPVNVPLDVWNHAICRKTEKVLRTSCVTFFNYFVTVTKIRNFLSDLRILVTLHRNTETLFWRKFALKAVHWCNFLKSFIMIILKRPFLDRANRLFNWWVWVVAHDFIIILFDDNESLLVRILWFFNFKFLGIFAFLSYHRFVFWKLSSYGSFFYSFIFHSFK